MRLIYCYDAYCGWCYAFSPIIEKIQETIGRQINIEVVSGGMLIPNYNMPIDVVAPTMLQLITQIEEQTGATFGEDYLWHLKNPELSDWYPNSLQPAIALSIIKDIALEKSLDFALKIQYGLNYEGRDLTDFEAYRHILHEFNLDVEDFYTKMKEEKYKLRALEDFNICKQLKVNSFPSLFIQLSENKFFQVTNGYLNYDNVIERIKKLQTEIIAQLN
jgi:putative protein-disulfide isomerase